MFNMARKVKEALKVVKPTPVEEVKKEEPTVCSNCNASGLKCSVCGVGSMVY